MTRSGILFRHVPAQNNPWAWPIWEVCSNQSCMCGCKVYECATKYAGVMSVTENAQKQRHLVVFQVCDLNVTHRIYNFSPGLTTLPNKNSRMFTLRWCKSPAKCRQIIIINGTITIGTLPCLARWARSLNIAASSNAGPMLIRGLMYLRGFLTKTLRTKSGKLLRTNKSGCINPCVSTISRRFSLYIPINVKLSAHARARLSALTPPSFNMLISINRPAVVRLLGDNKKL